MDTDSLPAIVLNDQYLYNLALACSRTARNQYGTGDTFQPVHVAYYRAAFRRNPLFIKAINPHTIDDVNWDIFTETMFDHFVRNDLL